MISTKNIKSEDQFRYVVICVKEYFFVIRHIKKCWNGLHMSSSQFQSSSKFNEHPVTNRWGTNIVLPYLHVWMIKVIYDISLYTANITNHLLWYDKVILLWRLFWINKWVSYWLRHFDKQKYIKELCNI